MILDRFRLDGKLALVTGCSRGIGKAMAEGLAEAGADVIGVSASLPIAGSFFLTAAILEPASPCTLF
jgi:2-deoxy-D-gluconate 3-dehydrogenase